MNLFPDKLRNLMLPCIIEKNQDKEIKEEINNHNTIPREIPEGNEEIISGSTCYENQKIENVIIDEVLGI
jgi:hypothetical protein